MPVITLISTAKQECTMAVAGTLTLGAEYPEVQGILAGASEAVGGGATEGLFLELLVRYKDQSFSTSWTRAIFEIDTGTLVRQSTLRTKEEGGAETTADLDFDSGQDLLVFGSMSQNALDDMVGAKIATDISTLEATLVAYINRFSVGLEVLTSNGANSTGGFLRGTSDSVPVTPYSGTTKLLVTISGDMRVDRVSGTAGLIAAEMRGGYVNSSGTDTEFGQVCSVISNPQYSVVDGYAEMGVTTTFLLDNTNYNASGDWVTFPFHKGTNGNFSSNLSNVWVRYQEIDG